MAGKPMWTAAQFIEAIPGTGGIVSAIARKIGCDWHTAKKYIETYPTIKQAYDDEYESTLDLAESVVLRSIKEGDSGDAKWYLSRKGKHRGYAERKEVDLNPDGDRLEIGVNVIDYRNGLTPLAPRPIPDSDPSSQDEDPGDGSEMG